MSNIYFNKKVMGQRLYNLRNKNHMTQNELKILLNISSNRIIDKWENGIATPTLNNSIKICNLFNVCLDDFVSYTVIKQVEK